MKMEAFIKGVGIISPQHTFNTSGFLSEVIEHNSNFLHCVEPSYKEFLNPIMARRMSRIIKMSIAATSVCLKDAGIEMPDAIMTGTALGCHEDTEKFLLSIIGNDEQFLTPTSFMQSTHNTVSGQIALQLKCFSYNFTFVHKGFSFESALLDGLMTIAEGDGKNVLIGSHDEMTEKYWLVCSRVNSWKDEMLPTMELIHSKTEGTVSGEGAAFFVLSNEESEKNYAKIRSIKTIYKPTDQNEIEKKISEMLLEKGLSANDIDLVIYGYNGDVRYNEVYTDLRNNFFKNSTSAYFKHLCGEYQTCGSFAMWMAAKVLKTQTIPEAVIIENKHRSTIKNVLIYNTYTNTDHSIYLLSKC